MKCINNSEEVSCDNLWIQEKYQVIAPDDDSWIMPRRGNGYCQVNCRLHSRCEWERDMWHGRIGLNWNIRFITRTTGICRQSSRRKSCYETVFPIAKRVVWVFWGVMGFLFVMSVTTELWENMKYWWGLWQWDGYDSAPRDWSYGNRLGKSELWYTLFGNCSLYKLEASSFNYVIFCDREMDVSLGLCLNAQINWCPGFFTC